MKKSDEIKQEIIETVRKLNPTKAALCRKFGITWQSLQNWMKEDEDFCAAYKKAAREYLDKINIEAKKSLSKLVKGYDYEEIKTIYVAGADGEPVIAQKTVIKKHVPPNATAVTYALSNLDPENFE